MLEHPEITRALVTGYPRRDAVCTCERCGQAAEPGDPDFSRLYNWLGDYICADCLKEEINGMDAGELARLLQLDVMDCR